MHSAPASSACCCFHVVEPTLQQALDDSASVALHPSFGSVSGIAEKYGLASLTTAASVQDTASAMLHEIREQEEEEQGTALQRNREAREVPTPFPASVCSARDRRCSQVVDATRLSLQRFAAMFSVGYRKIIEAHQSVHFTRDGRLTTARRCLQINADAMLPRANPLYSFK